MPHVFFDIWEDQQGLLVQERSVSLPEGKSVPMILIATLKAVDVEDALRQMRALRPYEMPRFYHIWKDDSGGIGIGVEGHALCGPGAAILRTFWAETFQQASDEWEALCAERSLPLE